MKKRFQFRIVTISLAFLCLLSFSSCQTEKKVTVIKLGHCLTIVHPVHKAMVFMAQQVAEKSDGKMRIDIYPAQQLGTEREMVELLQIGSLGITKVSASVIEGFVPAFKVFTIPYLFRDDIHRFKVEEGPIGRDLLVRGEKYWLRGLCYYDAGSRSFYTKDKPILTPDDLKGIKIRTMESTTAIKMIQVMGGSATPIAWGELYTSLQQGIVDGAENNPPSFQLSKHYEVCKYYSIDEHTSVPDVLLISTVVWNKLTPEEQKILQEAADASAKLQKELWKVATQEALAEVEKAGVKISYPDKKAFVKIVQPIYDEYAAQPELGEIMRAIQEVE
ncbi:MAG: TRAP transporter substrate-binding protein [Candidatus Marinimicrobia bacterium]|nr:TRAP transporter substrate-binding protein [Candidatus Neomarinimicrobiota bacterium]